MSSSSDNKNFIPDIVSGQQLDYRGIFQRTPRTLTDGRFNVYKERIMLWRAATGYNTEALLTKLFFLYLGGLIAARRQFIPSFAYFMNTHFNWYKAAKYLVSGYGVGVLISTFSFGHPFLLEDFIRGYFRSLTYKPAIERENQFR